MKKLLVPVLVAALTPVSLGKVWVTVYQHDGKTPLAAVDADHPNVYRDIMVGTRLTLIISSDTGEKWGGLLQLSWDDANDARLTGRGLTPPAPGSPFKFSTYKDSALNAAGAKASVRDLQDMYGIGLDFHNDTSLPISGGTRPAYPGDWFIVDYYAEQVGTCNVELYGSSGGPDVLLQTLSFTHVPSRDFNHDSRVDFQDFARFASGWRSADPGSSPTADLDLNTDGRVDLADLVSFSRYWLERLDSPITPEPVEIFDEGWENATAGVYAPGSTIDSDAGSWLVEDVISQISGCGLSPQRAEILADNGRHALQLRSVESLSGCPDTVAISLQEINGTNMELDIPLAPDTVISFNEVGELIDPRTYDPGEDRLGRPGFDNISLLLKDNNRNYLLYVLQRGPGAVASVADPKLANRYREIFLDPAAGGYRRNLFADFQTIPAFYAPKAKITFIVFRVDQHGSAILDDLVIGPEAPADVAASPAASAQP